ncbi:hypothetical protein AB0O91_36710 [Kitasatospora sp. NPDC089797]|uniref:hypothetical protein n=1 Tax=Kitasatospora sp. NPDC089797 TaxID=3155298 RepID=UPI00341D124C
MTPRQRALRIAEAAMVRLHGDPKTWPQRDLEDRRDLMVRVDNELRLIELTTCTCAVPAVPGPERRAS